MRHMLTRDQVLGWREHWNLADIKLIEHALDTLGDPYCYETGSRQYVAVQAEGRVALQIAPGYLYWTSPKWSDRIDPTLTPGGLGGGDNDKGRWYALSTFRSRGDASAPSFEEFAAPCVNCWMTPAVNGACGCD
jgi:hypothetical protein